MKNQRRDDFRVDFMLRKIDSCLISNMMDDETLVSVSI